MLAIANAPCKGLGRCMEMERTPQFSVGIWRSLFGNGTGNGASMMLCILGIVGEFYCLALGKYYRRMSLNDDMSVFWPGDVVAS